MIRLLVSSEHFKRPFLRNFTGICTTSRFLYLSESVSSLRSFASKNGFQKMGRQFLQFVENKCASLSFAGLLTYNQTNKMITWTEMYGNVQSERERERERERYRERGSLSNRVVDFSLLLIHLRAQAVDGRTAVLLQDLAQCSSFSSGWPSRSGAPEAWSRLNERQQYNDHPQTIKKETPPKASRWEPAT